MSHSADLLTFGRYSGLAWHEEVTHVSRASPFSSRISPSNVSEWLLPLPVVNQLKMLHSDPCAISYLATVLELESSSMVS